MKTISQILVVGLSALGLLSSCKEGVKETENGLKYIIFTANEGVKPKYGDMIYYDITVKNAKDSVLQSSFEDPDTAMMFLQEPPFKGSIEEGITLMSEGDSAQFFVPVDSLVDPNNIPPFLEKGSMLTITLKLHKVKTREEFMAIQNKEKEKQANADEELIKKYNEDKKLGATRDSSGLYIKKSKETNGKAIAPFDTVEVHYKGYTLDGAEFDNSFKRNEPFKLIVGMGMVIKGWDLGLQKLKEGEKATIIIPSPLAYGTRGSGNAIQPNTVIAFDVEIVKVKKANFAAQNNVPKP